MQWYFYLVYKFTYPKNSIGQFIFWLTQIWSNYNKEQAIISISIYLLVFILIININFLFFVRP